MLSPHSQNQLLAYNSPSTLTHVQQCDGLLMPNGSLYSGPLVEGRPEGDGRLLYPNGEKYEGHFSRGMKNGTGKYYYRNGDYYIGQWYNNKKEGEGIYFYTDNRRYEGQFKNNMKHGQGKIYEENGNYYEGEFEENFKDGQGSYYDAKDNKAFRLVFKKGKEVSCVQIAKFLPSLEDSEMVSSANSLKNNNQMPLIAANRLIRSILSTYIRSQNKSELNPSERDNKSLYSCSIAEVCEPFQLQPQSKQQSQPVQLLYKNQGLLQKRVDQWECNQVAEWLDEIGFADYIDEFKNERVRGPALLHLQEHDLVELTLANSAERKVLLREVELLKMVFKRQCLDAPITVLQKRAISLDLIRRIEKHEEKRKKKPQDTSKQVEPITFLPSATPQSDVRSDSSTSSGSEDEEKKTDSERKLLSKKKSLKVTMQNKIQTYLRKKGIVFKVVIPREEVRITKTIGKGSYGQVFLASWMGQDFAVKRYTKRKGFRNRHIAHFLEEAEVLNRIMHPNIVLCMGMFIENNEYSIVMEYMPGGSLFDYLHLKGNRPSEQRIYKYLKDISRGMSYLHGKNILHCDLKSSNVLLSESTAKISDFGLSQNRKIKGVHTKAAKFGTPQWMAPQVLLYKSYEKASDVFSFGIIIWELLTCEIPYREYTEKQAIDIIARGEQNTLYTPDYPNELYLNLFLKCTARQPSHRITFPQIVDLLEEQQPKYAVSRKKSHPRVDN